MGETLVTIMVWIGVLAIWIGLVILSIKEEW